MVLAVTCEGVDVEVNEFEVLVDCHYLIFKRML